MKKKILAIHQGHELYGSDRSFITTIKLLKENYSNIFITVIIPKKGPIVEELIKFADKVEIDDLGVVSLSDAKRYPFKFLFKVFKAAFKAKKQINGADIIYINTIVPFGYILASFFTFKPVIVHIREIPSKVLAKIFSIWFKCSRVNTICNSYSTQKAFNLSKKSEVIWNGVEKLLKDDSIEIKNEKIKLLLIGRINRWKGQNFFVETFSKLDDNQKNNFEVYIVGETPENQQFYREELQNTIFTNNLEKYIKLFPFDKNPNKYFSWADIIVVPSLQPEPFGRVAIEAMSLGKPVIASNHGGLSEIVLKDKTGWLFEPTMMDELKNILINIENDKNTISFYGNTSKQRFEENFTEDIYRIRIIKYFNKRIKDEKLY